MTDGCWLWTGATTNGGYGGFRLEGRYLGAHRVAYERIVGPIPEGLTLDHLCRVPRCVNPDHLEPVTLRENLLRGETAAAKWAFRSECENGHAFTPDNVYIRGDGYRRCATCTRAQVNARSRAKRAA